MARRNQVCFESNTDGIWPIRLTQQGRNNFTVTYGLQTKAGLTYTQAATELGAAIMHLAACEAMLDNRMPGER